MSSGAQGLSAATGKGPLLEGGTYCLLVFLFLLAQLVEGLQKNPRIGRVGFALGGERVLGVSLLPQIGGTSVAGWNLPELRILEVP